MGYLESHEKHLADLDKYVSTLFPDGLPDWIPIADVEKIKSTAAKYLNVPPVSIIKSIGVVFDWKNNNDDEALFSRCQELNVSVVDAEYFTTVFRAIEDGIRRGLPLLLGGRQTALTVKEARKARAANLGKKKAGHEGPLKTLLRDIMGKKKMSFEDVCAALNSHVMVECFDDTLLSFFYKKDGKDVIKDVQIPAIRKAYREILKTLS